MKCLLKNLGQIQCAKVPRCLSWNQFFWHIYLFFWHIKSVTSICPVGKWRDTNSTSQNLDWKTLSWLHWKWLHFQPIIL